MPESLDPRTPVIVGVGQAMQRPDDLTDAVEAVALMEQAVRAAADDSGRPAITDRADVVAVVLGAWRYSDPARLVAGRIGRPDATTMLSSNGGNTPQALVNHLAARIADGELDTAVITGAETIWSRRRQRKAGIDRAVTNQDENVEPDERFQVDIAMSTEFEKARGLVEPINLYPIFESAIAADRGHTIDEHRDHLAALWERFNRVAVANPYAWRRTPMTAAEIRSPAEGNRMVGFPYTKAMNSNWDLDQGAAIILCSAGAASAAGIARDRWVFPVAGTEADDTYAVTERRDLHSSPAIAAAGAALFELAATGPDELAHVDLYSCFPSAVQISAAALGLSLDRQLTVTGGLTFAGGPLNNYVSHSIATMTDVLRNDEGALGLVTANGGYITKHALGLYATEPPRNGFAHRNVQAEVDAVPGTPADIEFTGRATIEAATVMHDREGPAAGLVAVATPNGGRTWGRTTDPEAMAALMSDGAVGTSIQLDRDGGLEIVSDG